MNKHGMGVACVFESSRLKTAHCSAVNHPLSSQYLMSPCCGRLSWCAAVRPVVRPESVADPCAEVRAVSCLWVEVSWGGLGGMITERKKQAKGYFWKVFCVFFPHKVISKQCFCFLHELQVSCCEMTDVIVQRLQVFRFKFNSSASLLSYYAQFRQQIVSPLASMWSEMGQTSCTPNSFGSLSYFSPNWSQSLFLTDTSNYNKSL